MMNDILIVSDCCGAEMTPIHAEHGVCPQCGEHCEIITDDSLERDYIPGYDDGEW